MGAKSWRKSEPRAGACGVFSYKTPTGLNQQGARREGPGPDRTLASPKLVFGMFRAAMYEIHSQLV